ncbi:indole-3-acetic acid-amido synthetase GH3.10 [Cicer arietinum]|uniref:Indole-3-acetic acid-amido synthetase GH3.10 n=1 Tax=Cicer arietinum TaxID=3827 RepID=A0A1S2XCP4_CICAR|nr:indole-3-acetic acid-amido synthetase GH3.10 [Cicer arietinum]
MESSNVNIECDNILTWFEDVSKNASSVQTQILCKILKQNNEVEYLKKWFGSYNVQDMDACALESLFTSVVPLASHADFDPFIQRIALSLSSGTTEGRQKFVAFTRHSAQTTLQIFTLAAATRSKIYPTKEGGRILEFIYSSNQYKTKGGLTVGTATTHYYASEEFKIKQEKTKLFNCSPYQVISSGDYKQTTYCHLLLGLFFSNEVEFISSAFVYGIVQAFCTLEELWREICNDIRYGTLSSKIKLPKMREGVLSIISSNSNPFLASKLEATCKELELVDWFGLVPKLWPNAKYIYSIMTGSMLPYLKKVRHYAKGVPLVSGDYGSTESWIGVNVDPILPPENVTFAVVPTFSYFEFIPLYRHKQDFSFVHDDFMEDKPIPLSKVQIGQEYEIVLTTFTGLYRYRLGDVVEVTGFHNGTPKLNFICRRKLILTINVDKNTEKDLQIVVEKGSQVLNKAKTELVDFTSYANMSNSNQPGFYVIFWEIKGEAEDKVLEACCTEIDAAFVDHGYVVSRKTNSIGPLKLCIVEKGTFKKILDHFVANGGALGQFKTPRCTNNPMLLEILNACTIKTFCSNAYDSTQP